MKAGIHPEYKAVNATCSCGNSFVFNSTLGKDTMHLDVCDKCHPFYSGKQRIVDNLWVVLSASTSVSAHCLRRSNFCFTLDFEKGRFGVLFS